MWKIHVSGTKVGNIHSSGVKNQRRRGTRDPSWNRGCCCCCWRQGCGSRRCCWGQDCGSRRCCWRQGCGSRAPAGGTNATPPSTAAAEAAGRAEPEEFEPEMPGADGALMSDENGDDEDRAPAPTKADSPPRARASTRAVLSGVKCRKSSGSLEMSVMPLNGQTVDPRNCEAGMC